MLGDSKPDMAKMSGCREFGRVGAPRLASASLLLRLSWLEHKFYPLEDRIDAIRR
jgi:hypothetical protein